MINYEELMKHVYVDEEYTYPSPTEESIKRAEENIGYKLPASYIDFLKHINGCGIEDDLYITNIFGIDPTGSLVGGFGLEYNYELYINDGCGYPEIGVPIIDTMSAGHDVVFLDYRESKDDPAVVLVDQETEEEVYIADNFEQFLQRMIDGNNVPEIE